MPYANISATLSDADKTAIITKLNEAKALLTFLINLTGAEKKGLQSLTAGNEPFVTKALTYAEANPNLVPPFVSITELRKDYNLALALLAIQQVLLPLAGALDDTNRAVGNEAWEAALKFYRAVQMAAEMNVPGADVIAEDLGERFVKASASNDTPPNPPNP
mgnify:FL=1